MHDPSQRCIKDVADRPLACHDTPIDVPAGSDTEPPRPTVATQLQHLGPLREEMLAASECAYARISHLRHTEVSEEALGAVDLRRRLIDLDHRDVGHDLAVDETFEVLDCRAWLDLFLVMA